MMKTQNATALLTTGTARVEFVRDAVIIAIGGTDDDRNLLDLP